MWLTMIFRNWQVVVIGLLGFALTLSTLYGRVLKAELGEKTAAIEYMKREAQNYHIRSDQIAKETSDGYQALVEQIKDKNLAISNAKKRFGNAACGIRANGLLVPASAGQADVPKGTGEPSVEERLAVTTEFVNGCAEDSAFVKATHEWRIGNQLPISKE